VALFYKDIIDRSV